MLTRSKTAHSQPPLCLTTSLSNAPLIEPSSFKEAARHAQWQQAMTEEFHALKSQGTWSLVPLPAHKNVIGCKWIFRIKKNSDGSVACY